MNPIEKLQERILRRMPEVNAHLDPAENPKGPWWLDLRHNGYWVVVEWRPGQGFGLSSTSGEGAYGEGPDEVYTKAVDAEARLLELLESRKETIPPHPVLVSRLRELRGLTQEQIAEKLGVRQPTISRIERGDMYLSTLSRLVTSMGGKLQIQAVFPDSIIPLDPPEEQTTKTTPIKAGRKRSVAR